MIRRNKNLLFTTIFTSFLFLITILLIEIVAAFFLNNSAILPDKLLLAFRMHYMSKDRNLIQYSSDCAIYDSDLTYTLKPGGCHTKGREFEAEYFVNSAGMRDDDASLVSPKIVVIGDSHTMGWGVSQDLIFSNLLEKKLGMPVLNTGVSSYGTVRELKMLERANLDNLEYLIIQYCDNDFEENNEYLKNNNKLPIMPEFKYNIFTEHLEKQSEYFIGKHSMNLLLILTKIFTSDSILKDNGAEGSEEVNAFLNAILKSNIDLSNVVIIALEINGYNQNDSLFINSLKNRLSDKNLQLAVKDIKIIDSSLILNDDNYFILDDHMNSSGHKAIAEALAESILSTRNNQNQPEARRP